MIAGSDQICIVKKCLLRLIAAASLSIPFTPAKADPQLPDQLAPGQIDADQDPEYDGLDITRPQNRFDIFFQYRTSDSTNQVTQETERLRVDTRFDFSPIWRLGVLAELPIVERQTPSSNSTVAANEFGIGDAYIQPTLVRKLDPQWSIAFGARLIGPTADDALGTGKWQALPILAARYEWAPDSFFAPLVRYATSFAGDPSRSSISNLQMQPLLNIGLPKNWFIAFYPSPDIRINYGNPLPGQTGQLFLPADLLVGIKMNENLVIGLEVSEPIIKDYPVYNFKTELRVQVTF